MSFSEKLVQFGVTFFLSDYIKKVGINLVLRAGDPIGNGGSL